MPRQYEIEKRRIDRQRRAKEIAPNMSNSRKSDDEASGPNSPTLEENQFSLETNDKRIRKALVKTYLQVQSKLEKQTQFDCSLSGSTLVGIYHHENTIYFANAGDSRGIIVGESTPARSAEYMHERGGDAFSDVQIVILASTRDHKPDL